MYININGPMGYQRVMVGSDSYPFYDREFDYGPRPAYRVFDEYDEEGHLWYGIEHTPSGKRVEHITKRQVDIFFIYAKVRDAEPDPEQLEAFINSCR